MTLDHWQRLHRETSPHGLIRSHDPTSSPVFERGQGAWLWDTEGRDYLDLVCGYSSLNFGHAHPRLIAAARDQLGILTHLTGQPTPWRIELSKRLSMLAPVRQPAKAWLATNGSRAIEIAWKIASQVRPGILVSFDQAYHGRSIACCQISHTPRVAFPGLSVDRHLMYPDCVRCPLQLDRRDCHAACTVTTEDWLEQHANEISAVIIEPGLGARGYEFPPADFFHRVRQATARHGILMIDDEVQMGLGRMGSLFACQRQNWQPDLIVLGKSLGGGLVPISAVIGYSKLIDSLPEGVESETFSGNPLAARIGLEVLDLLEEEELCSRADRIGTRLRATLRAALSWLPDEFIVDGQGASATIECDPQNPLAGALIAAQWTQHCREMGVLVHLSGRCQNRLVLIPPLIIQDDELDEAVRRIKLASQCLNGTRESGIRVRLD